MHNYSLFEYISNGFNSEYIYLISAISIIFGVLIITTKNPIFSILFLIGLFVAISLYLILIGLPFMGLSYLLVYVGAVSILFIFILMLINVRISELLTEGKNSIPLALLIVLCFNFTVNSIYTYSIHMFDTTLKDITDVYEWIVKSLSIIVPDQSREINTVIASVTSNSWDSSLIESNHITTIGNVMYTNLFILLVITSLILLVAMVGTIAVTITKK